MILPCLVLPPVFFVALVYPQAEADIETRQPLLTTYYLAGQLRKEIASAESRGKEMPPNYGTILADYGSLPSNRQILGLSELSGATSRSTLSQRLVEKVVLWREGLPGDFLQADPVKEIGDVIQQLRLKEKGLDRERTRIIRRNRLEYLTFQPSNDVSPPPVRRGLPPAIMKAGLTFCGEPVPLIRRDVRQRIENQIEYLLTDFRENTGLWLKRTDRYGRVVGSILGEEKIPAEFTLLPALESSYSGDIVSPARALGWWQFRKFTAVNSSTKDPSLDWSLRVDRWRDERSDLALSTRSAARYLNWLRSRLKTNHAEPSWLTVAAAYNAGVSEILYRITAYKTSQFWDLKLPKETEEYVPRWIALRIIDSHRKFYDLHIPRVQPLEFDTLSDVRLEKDLPLAVLAAITDSSVRFVSEINGSLRRNQSSFKAARGARGHAWEIHVPRGTRELVLRKLRDLNYLASN